jgi:putative endonuclease
VSIDNPVRASLSGVTGTSPVTTEIVVRAHLLIHPSTMEREYYVCILASRPGGALYVGVTNDLVRRVYEHKQGAVASHTKRYNISQLVYFEAYPSVEDAIQREKNIKHWPRAWKTKLISENNSDWRDLFDEIAQ